MKRFRVISTVLVLMLLVVACNANKSDGTNANTEASKTPSTEASTEVASDVGTETDTESKESDSNISLPIIRVGSNPGTGNIYANIIEAKGFDKEEGYITELIPFSNSTDALTALQANKIDVGVNFGTAAPLTFITNGADFAMFGGYVNGGMPIIAPADFEYKGLESFVGKKVATARMYTPDVIWRGAMHNAGYDLEKDVEIMEFKKPSEVLEAVKSGKADIGCGTNSTYLAALESGLKAITWTNDLAPNGVCCRQVANNSWVSENPELVKGYLKSIIRAEDVLYNDQEFAVKAFQDNMEYEPEKSKQLLLETNQELETDPKSNGILAMWDMLQGIGYIEPKDIDIKKNINIKLYKRALDELVEEHPENQYFKKLLDRYQEYNSVLLSDN